MNTTFYALRTGRDYVSSQTGGGYFGYSHTVRNALPFLTIPALLKAIAKRADRGLNADFCIVRVEVVPGETIPAKTERRVVQPGDILPADAKWAVLEAGCDCFLKVPAKCWNNLVSSLDEAALFTTEEDALVALQNAAISNGDKHGAYSGMQLVRVIETTTPSPSKYIETVVG